MEEANFPEGLGVMEYSNEIMKLFIVVYKVNTQTFTTITELKLMLHFIIIINSIKNK